MPSSLQPDIQIYSMAIGYTLSNNSSHIYKTNVGVLHIKIRIEREDGSSLVCYVLGHLLPQPIENCEYFVKQSSNGFFWEDCSAADEPVKFKEINVKPNPIRLPGEISHTGSVYFNMSLSSMTGEITLYKKFFFWWKIPCLDILKCYFDACELWRNVSPCHFNKGSVSSSKEKQYLPRPSIPFFILHGYYSATVILKSHEKQVGCANIYFSIDDS
ncbi:ganglioside GM2 activator-like [Mustelus asterias]